MSELKIEEIDIYEILGINSKCTIREIKKAYRRKALECHPDKNPDNPNAAKQFHELSKILEILIDDSARKAYDKVLHAKKAAELRHRELDSHRKKLKEDLELRERQAGRNTPTEYDDLKKEIERLRKETSKHLQEEMEYVSKLVKDSQQGSSTEEWDSTKYRIKIKWNARAYDDTNGGYTYEMLHRFLTKYGDVIALVMSPKRTGTALVEFKTRRGAEMAMELEQGLAANPLKLRWVNGPPRKNKNPESTLIKETDYESLVLHRMRQAEERKQLIEQMMADENDE